MQSAMISQSQSQSQSQRGSRSSRCSGITNSHNDTMNFGKIGRIRQMRLVNFMCHANLFVDFNERINIFVGHNGSGKSAILTALVIGLGCTASIASRSSNVKQLIRRGETAATIEIHLDNDGFDAFEQETYGNKIIVVRHITASGSSTYKIKDENGGVQSTSLTDLRQILMYMNIQVDNPICVLNQEAARTFLKESDPKKRYTLFQKATQIETVLSKLNDCVPPYNTAKSRMAMMQKQEEAQLKDLKEVQEKYIQLKSVESLKNDVNLLNVELAWSFVREHENIIQEFQQKVAEQEVKIAELNSKINRRTETLDSMKTLLTTFVTEIAAIKSSVAQKKQQYNTKRNEFTASTNDTMNQKRLYKSLSAKALRLETEILQLKESIEKRSGNYAERIKQMKDENNNKLTELLKNREEKQLIMENLKRDADMLKDNTERVKNELDSLRNQKRNIVERESRLSGQLQEINSKANNKYTLYGAHMPRLLQMIEKYHKRGVFSEKPRGPIGQYIDVPNSKWRAVFENIARSHLTTFCFNSVKDRQEFDKMVQREFGEIPKFTKIVTKFVKKVYDVRDGMVNPPQGTVLLLNEITVSDPVVKNILIDQLKIETILLCEGSKDAVYYASDLSRVPRNVSKIMSLEPFAEYLPAPNFRSYGMVLKPCRYLQKDLKAYKSQLEREIQEVKEELSGIQEIWDDKQNAVNSIQKEIRDKNNKMSANESAIQSLQRQILEIKNIEYPYENEVEVLQREKDELELVYADTKTKLDVERDKTSALEMTAEANEREISALKSELSEVEVSLQRKSSRYDKVAADIQSFQRNEQYLEKEISDIKAEKITIEKRLTLTQQSCIQLTEKATVAGAKIDNERTEVQIKDLIRKVESKIKTVCALKDDINVVLELKLNKEMAHNYSVKCLEATSDIFASLGEALLSRRKWVQKFQQGISLNVKSVFLRILKIRNYRGELNINNRDKKLELDVVPQDKDIPNAVSNTKSLSGGERSFATLAFLLSLWSCVSQPFYFLDEYDVFTDEVNRSIMTNLLINEARRRYDRQFCFFTPQDMSFVAPSDDITFHQLQDHRTNDD